MARDDDQRTFVLRTVEEREIRFVRLWFTDVLGFLKSFSIPAQELPEALEEGVGFDGSAHRRLRPRPGSRHDRATRRVDLPGPAVAPTSPAWRGCSATSIRPDGPPFAGDPRLVLRRVVSRAAELGFSFYVGPEIEFFLFDGPTDPKPLDVGSYFDLTPLDIGSDFRQRAIPTSRSGIPVKDSHHEVAASQHEIDLRHTDAIAMSDAIMTCRLVVKEVARELGVYATFMPKPIQGAFGSGMHTHVSLFEGDRNAFFDPTGEHSLSKVARCFIAGLLRHARAITAVTNQWTNSYKRLVPGYEAPVHVGWGARNRSALIRVPLTKPHKEAACRIEYRAPDPACNPYLSFALILAAGLDGIDREDELPPEMTDDVWSMGDAERIGRGIPVLPESLPEALVEMGSSELVREVLGEHLFEWFIANKRAEWDEYRTYVTGLELERNLPRL